MYATWSRYCTIHTSLHNYPTCAWLQLEILTADADLYLAKVDDKVMVKLGPRFDLGGCVRLASFTSMHSTSLGATDESVHICKSDRTLLTCAFLRGAQDGAPGV